MEHENNSEVRQAKEGGQVQKEQTVEPEEKVEPVEPEEVIDPPSNAHCPNCNGPGIRKGKTILCQLCNCSFRYTREGPMVAELGPFDKLEARVARLEGSGMAEPVELQPAEPKVSQPAEPDNFDPPLVHKVEDDGI